MNVVRKHLSTIFFAGAILIGTLAWQSQALKQGAPSTPVVLVSVDIERVFGALEERAFEQSKLQALIDSMQNDLELRRQNIDNFEQEFELYKPGSDKWDELIQEQQLAALEYQAQVEFTRRRAAREESNGMRRVYEHIREASATLAKQHGWDYVFVNDAIVTLPEGDNVDMDVQISSRRMLFASSLYDITNELIEYMNASFDEMAVR
jgi:Skp family chaperone for outer membrane proteins